MFCLRSGSGVPRLGVGGVTFYCGGKGSCMVFLYVVEGGGGEGVGGWELRLGRALKDLNQRL